MIFYFIKMELLARFEKQKKIPTTIVKKVSVIDSEKN